MQPQVLPVTWQATLKPSLQITHLGRVKKDNRRQTRRGMGEDKVPTCTNEQDFGRTIRDTGEREWGAHRTSNLGRVDIVISAQNFFFRCETPACEERGTPDAGNSVVRAFYVIYFSQCAPVPASHTTLEIFQPCKMFTANVRRENSQVPHGTPVRLLRFGSVRSGSVQIGPLQLPVPFI